MKTTLRESQVWQEILAAHAERQTTPPRLMVNEEFLVRWGDGQISERERQELLEELGTSRESRDILQVLLECGALTLPASDRDDMPEVLKESERPTVVSEKEETHVTDLSSPPIFGIKASEVVRATDEVKQPRRSLAAWLPLVLVAAGVAVAVTLSIMNPSGNQPLADAQDAMKSNNLQKAFDEADKALGVADTASEREAAFEIMCESGEQLADTALTEGRFEDVRLISDRVSEHEGIAATADDATRELLGQIESLRLQARRGIDSAITSPQVEGLSNLLNQGFDPLGADGNMTQIEVDEIREEYEQAIVQFPLSQDLRLNFGQFLLEHQDAAAAIEQFRAVLEGNPVAGLVADPENRNALMGLAIAVAKDPSQASAMEAMEKLQEMLGEDGASDVLNMIQGLNASDPSELIPEGLMPSVDSLDSLFNRLQNPQEDDDPSGADDEPDSESTGDAEPE